MLHVLRRKFKFKLPDGVSDNLPLLVLLCFASSVVVMGLFSLFLYVFKLPAILFTAFYACSLVTAIGYFGRFLWLVSAKKRTFKIPGRKFWITTIITAAAICLLLADYLISLVFGTQFAGGADTYVHIAKIMGLINYGFVIDDSILKGVVESRYHVNVIHSLFIPLPQMLPISVAEVWNLSLGFFRMMQWLSIMGLAYFVAMSWLGMKKMGAYYLSVVSLFVALALPPSYMYVAMYPTKVVVFWLILLVIGLSLMWAYQKIGITLASGAVILIALTQPTYSLMAGLFLIVYLLAILIWSYVRRNRIDGFYVKVIAGLIFALLVSPFITALFPQHLSEELVAVGSLPTINIFGVSIVAPALPAEPFALALSLIGLTGYVYVIATLFKRSQPQIALLGIALLSFYYVLVHNPVFMAVAHDRLPLWLLGRFTAMDVLQLVMIPFGLYAIGKFLMRFVKPRTRQWWVVATLFCLIVTGFIFVGIKQTYKGFYEGTKAIDHGRYKLLQRVEDTMSGVMEPGSLVATTMGDSYFLPSAIPVKTIAIDSTHATPTAASKERLACQERIFAEDLDWESLTMTKTDYIVVPQWNDRIKELRNVAEHSPNKFSLIKETQDYIIYKVKRQATTKTALDKTSPCYIYQIKENKRLY
ncbi:MAG TPA: hypothetical protein VFZ62_02375 [Candidatus Saccharimonadales bacterium]